jgi:hypothetical protein
LQAHPDGNPFAGAEVVTPIGMPAPSPDVLGVMWAEVITIPGAKAVLCPALIVVVSIVSAPVSILSSPAILSTPVLTAVLRGRCA